MYNKNDTEYTMHFFYYAENKTQLDICLIFDLLNHLRTDKSSDDLTNRRSGKYLTALYFLHSRRNA